MGSMLISLVLATGVVCPVSATIIQVPSGHATIQAGINAAASGDTVQVAPGTYTGPSNRNLDFGGKNILLRSSAGAPSTTIDCQSLARAIRFHTGETAAAIVQGFTIRNGLASGTFGGGILIEGGAAPTIRNCRFIANHANTGGGLYASSSVTLTDCVFEGNSADNWGGGVYGETANLPITRGTFTQNQAGLGAGIYANSGTTVTITDCVFTENTPLNLGGGIYASGSTVTIRRSNFVENMGKHGAGVYVLASAGEVDSCTFSANTAVISSAGLFWQGGPSLALTDCEFVGNVVTTGSTSFAGGGAGAYILDMGAIEVRSCTFRDNVAQQNAGLGAGLFLRNSISAFLSGTSFTNNSSPAQGGGLWAHGVPITMSGCTFAHNTAASGPGGGINASLSRLAISSSVFTENHSTDAGGAISGRGRTIVIDGSEFTGNTAFILGGAVAAKEDSCTITNCTFTGNSASLGGAVAHTIDFGARKPLTITGCTLAENSAGDGGALYAEQSAVDAEACTLVRNVAASGAGFAFTDDTSAIVSRVIVALSTSGEAIYCDNAGSTPALSCSDLFGNPGGDWTACIADQVGINGNFSLDPRFCNFVGRDYTLAQTSPCTAANAPAGCGLIGAHPVGCAAPIGVADPGAPAESPPAARVFRVLPNPLANAGFVAWENFTPAPERMSLYDAVGRLVVRHSLAAATQTKGSLSWPEFLGGRRVVPGVYFLRAEAGSEVKSHDAVETIVIVP
jgi:hypothetical protein